MMLNKTLEDAALARKLRCPPAPLRVPAGTHPLTRFAKNLRRCVLVLGLDLYTSIAGRGYLLGGLYGHQPRH